MAAITVQEAYDQFALWKKDISDVSQNTFIQWCNFLNKFYYRLVRGVDPSRFISTASYSTVVADGPDSQDLPEDFASIKEWGTGFWLLDNNNNITGTRLVLTGPSNIAYGYYIQNDQVIFTLPMTRNYTLRYLALPVALTSMDDDLLIDFEYIEYVVKAIDVLYAGWDEDPAAEGLADQRLTRIMADMTANISKVPEAYDMPDFSGNYAPSGSNYYPYM